MPGQKRKKRGYAGPGHYYPRRKAARTGIRSTTSTAISVNRSPGNFMPPMFYTSHSYGEQSSVTCVTQDTAYSLIYRLNSLYDPRFATGGGQPYGRDQMAAIYRLYTVLAVKWKVIFIPRPTTVSSDIICSVRPAADSVTPLTTNQLMEDRLAQFKVVTGHNPRAVIQGYGKLGKIMGLRQDTVQIANPQKADVEADPARQAYLMISAVSNNESNVPCEIYVYIKYYCKWQQIKTVGSS